MEVTVSDIVGQYLLKTTKDIPVYNGALQQIGIIPKGRTTPIVDSYIQRNGQLYWMFFQDIPGVQVGSWYIPHQKGNYILIPYKTNPTAHQSPDFFQRITENLPSLPSFNNVTKFVLPLALIVGGYYLYRIFK
jgi:hypothetical protein